MGPAPLLLPRVPTPAEELLETNTNPSLLCKWEHEEHRPWSESRGGHKNEQGLELSSHTKAG